MNYLKKSLAAHLACPQRSLMGRYALRLMKNKNAYLERCAVDCANISPDDHVLEVGFGQGLGLQHAAEKVTNGKVFGAEISTFAIDVASKLLFEEIERNKVVLFHTPVIDLPFNSDTIDVAFSCNSFYFWPDIPAGCRELHRVIKPGGQLLTVQNIASVLKRKHRGGFRCANVDFVAYMTTLEAAGFTDVKMEYLTDTLTSKSYQCICATVGS